MIKHYYLNSDAAKKAKQISRSLSIPDSAVMGTKKHIIIQNANTLPKTKSKNKKYTIILYTTLYYFICMTETAILTIRVKKNLKEKAKKFKIDISKTLRSALEEEIKKREEQELSKALMDIKDILQKIPDQEIVKTIRESRDQR